MKYIFVHYFLALQVLQQTHYQDAKGEKNIQTT